MGCGCPGNQAQPRFRAVIYGCGAWGDGSAAPPVGGLPVLPVANRARGTLLGL